MKKFTIIFIATILLCFSCEKDDDGNRVTYYKTIGEGYIFERDNNKPLQGVKITIRSCTNASPGFLTSGSWPAIEETFITDENGYFQLRFPKRINHYKVEIYRVHLLPYSALPPPPPYWSYETSSDNGPFTAINGVSYPDDIKDKKIIIYDTIKYYR